MIRSLWKRLAVMLVFAVCAAGLSGMDQLRMARPCLRYTGAAEGVAVTLDLYDDFDAYQAALPRYVRVFKEPDAREYSWIGTVRLSEAADFADALEVALTHGGGEQRALLFLDQDARDADGRMARGSFVGGMPKENAPVSQIALYQNGELVVSVPMADAPLPAILPSLTASYLFYRQVAAARK